MKKIFYVCIFFKSVFVFSCLAENSINICKSLYLAPITRQPTIDLDTEFILDSSKLWEKWDSVYGDMTNASYIELKSEIENKGVLVFETRAFETFKVKDYFKDKRMYLNAVIVPLMDSIEQKWGFEKLMYLKAVIIVLLEGVYQHGNKNAITLVRIEGDEIFLSVMDRGSGFASLDSSEKPSFIRNERGRLVQGPKSQGYGKGMGVLFNLTNELVVFTKGHFWSSETEDEAAPYNYIPKSSRGSLVFAHLNFKTPSNEIDYLDLAEYEFAPVDLNPRITSLKHLESAA